MWLYSSSSASLSEVLSQRELLGTNLFVHCVVFEKEVVEVCQLRAWENHEKGATVCVPCHLCHLVCNCVLLKNELLNLNLNLLTPSHLSSHSKSTGSLTSLLVGLVYIYVPQVKQNEQDK